MFGRYLMELPVSVGVFGDAPFGDDAPLFGLTLFLFELVGFFAPSEDEFAERRELVLEFVHFLLPLGVLLLVGCTGGEARRFLGAMGFYQFFEGVDVPLSAVGTVAQAFRVGRLSGLLGRVAAPVAFGT